MKKKPPLAASTFPSHKIVKSATCLLASRSSSTARQKPCVVDVCSATGWSMGRISSIRQAVRGGRLGKRLLRIGASLTAEFARF